MAFIIDRYNRYDSWDRERSVHVFEINDNWYAVKEVILFWGKPQLPTRVGEDRNPETYWVYGTKEEAMEFVQKMRKLNCGSTY